MGNSQRRKPRPSPFCLRLSEAERADLKARAGELSLAFYVKSLLFAEGPARVAPKSPTIDRRALGRALAVLGASHLASNLNQLAKAVHHGILPVSEQTEADLRDACAAVAEMRQQLLLALGIKTNGGKPPVADLRTTFGEVAGGQP